MRNKTWDMKSFDYVHTISIAFVIFCIFLHKETLKKHHLKDLIEWLNWIFVLSLKDCKERSIAETNWLQRTMKTTAVICLQIHICTKFVVYVTAISALQYFKSVAKINCKRNADNCWILRGQYWYQFKPNKKKDNKLLGYAPTWYESGEINESSDISKL